ncbi:TonB-dependent receptor [Sphingomonas sp. PR090111-T3T-6A]|uniref:TonB-dependent receptor n=1 Tax=Sphingomonas sp. PR090111-T3T-6A TaxID=685778 RepID=UPI000563BB62|nr:TonB-dependent receptor [Sphingomonas sp. PR090111-T3T-6A]
MSFTAIGRLGAAAAILYCGCGVAVAQTRRFDVPAQAARTGIPLFAHQAGIQILVPSELVGNVTVNRVAGSFEVTTALSMLLAGTDLVPVKAGNAIALRRRVADVTAGLTQVSVQMGSAAMPPQAMASVSSPGLPAEGADKEIVVTGIRASIQQSIAAKRNAGNIVDVISAQDIGKLPDQNVAESLSRVTGVQISRREGEGSQFTVRGISQNRLEINGRTYLGPTANGSPALETLSPEILSSIVVSKTPSADMPEGGLGATVNLKTKRPLDLKDFLVSGRIQGAYTDQADKAGLRTSGLVSKTFADNRFGVLAGIAYTRLDTTGYSFESGGWTQTNAIDANGDGVADPGLFRPNRIMFRTYDRKENRITANATLQWKPTDTLEFIVDGTYSKLHRTRNDENYQVLLNDNASNVVTDGHGTITGGSFSGVTLRPLVYDEPTRLQTTNLGASAKWDSGRWHVKLDGSYSKAKGSDGGPGASFTYVVVPRAGNVVNASYGLVPGHAVPDLSLASNFDINDPGQYQLASIFDSDSRSNNKGYDARIDTSYDLDMGPLRAVEAGFRFENLRLFAAYPQNTPSAASLLATADSNGNGVIDVSELPGLTYDNHFGSFFPGEAGNFPRTYLSGTLDADAARSGLGLPALDPYGAITVAQTSIADISQDTYAGYVKADVEGELGSIRYSGNAGVRFVSISRTSAGYLSPTQPISEAHDFHYVLPSANLKLDFTEKLSLRLAIAKVEARPDIANISVSFVPNTVSLTGSRGNPALKPFEATQYDASLEWYFAPASSLSAALFRKDVSSFTITSITQQTVPGFEQYGVFNISQPTNGADGRIQGVELGYQQMLKFLPGPLKHLGIQANYTYVDSKTPIIDPLTGGRLPMPGLSRNNFNLIGFYEDKTFSVRVAYTYRDKYLMAVQSAVSGGSIYQAAQGQLDASAQINLTNRIRLVIEGVNLDRTTSKQYLQYPGRLYTTLREDRRFFFGIAATF